ncbi:winged helix-turn-helix transcriptional regulator [Acetobacteraceae bacterium]|nr:winged helix-turn-helix transcriptional regulator [Candidatus Parcubacteria bacterium]
MKNALSNRPALGKPKSYRQLERIIKGFANHRRLEILNLLQAQPELSVEEIAERLSIGYVNASDHIRKLAIAGLVLKRSDGTSVRHALTTRATTILVFCKRLE